MTPNQVILAEAATRLTTAIKQQRTAVSHLMAAITETEASRKALHEAGDHCWVDRLDTENGKEK